MNKLKLLFICLTFIAFAVNAESKQDSQSFVLPDSQTFKELWSSGKAVSEEAWQDSKAGSKALWETGKNKSSEAWEQGKEDSQALWESSEESRNTLWDDIKSGSSDAWQGSKELVNDLLEKEDPIDNYDEI